MTEFLKLRVANDSQQHGENQSKTQFTMLRYKSCMTRRKKCISRLKVISFDTRNKKKAVKRATERKGITTPTEKYKALLPWGICLQNQNFRHKTIR